MTNEELLKQRLEQDAERPEQCQCGHSKLAHDSGYAFCWFCDCVLFKLPPQAIDAALAQSEKEKG